MATGVLDLEHTITDVIEGKEYLFSVTACNKCGPGEPAYIDEPVNVSSPASEYLFCQSEIDQLKSEADFIRAELQPRKCVSFCFYEHLLMQILSSYQIQIFLQNHKSHVRYVFVFLRQLYLTLLRT